MDAKVLGADLSKTIAKTIAPILKTQNTRIAELERCIAELQAEPKLRYMGVFEMGRTYLEGSLTTHAGSMWLAQRTTAAKPGTANAWKLVVKNGYG